jgi:TRAP transporter TAXI family solute receptor
MKKKSVSLNMSSEEFELTFQCDAVPYWVTLLGIISSALHVEFPSLRKTSINVIPGEFSTVSAVAEGEADMGLTTPPVCVGMAYRGVGPFSKKMENLRAIGSFPHDDRMMWAVTADSGINSIEEMKDKPHRLVVHHEEHPVRFAVEKILEAYGTSLNDLKRRGWQLIEEHHTLRMPVPVIEGRAEVVIEEARKTPPWIKLTQSRRMKFLPIREDILKMMEDEYGYRRGVLKKGMLRGIEEDVPCIDFSEWTMFVRDDMPDDLAYSITRIFDEGREQFESQFIHCPIENEGSKPGRNLTCPIDMKEVCRNVGDVPLHPAAKRYYEEHGYM